VLLVKNEIDKLKKDIEKKKIAEAPLIEEEEEEEEPSCDKKVSVRNSVRASGRLIFCAC
jgi:hypothetical protein